MTMLTYLTPNGQVTIPRSILKALNIIGESDVLIEVADGQLIIRKIEDRHVEPQEDLTCKAV
jgi:bifunctional DNA-binding transcriptional regulator/antitoxin component of YhaV-PrlF toxin-antitoxin module